VPFSSNASNAFYSSIDVSAVRWHREIEFWEITRRNCSFFHWPTQSLPITLMRGMVPATVIPAPVIMPDCRD
jgi:hypothetical protein